MTKARTSGERWTALRLILTQVERLAQTAARLQLLDQSVPAEERRTVAVRFDRRLALAERLVDRELGQLSLDAAMLDIADAKRKARRSHQQPLRMRHHATPKAHR